MSLETGVEKRGVAADRALEYGGDMPEDRQMAPWLMLRDHRWGR